MKVAAPAFVQELFSGPRTQRPHNFIAINPISQKCPVNEEQMNQRLTTIFEFASLALARNLWF
jgi:hypothetical protein